MLTKELLAAFLIFISAEHEGTLPDFDPDQISIPDVGYVTAEEAVYLVYGKNTFMKLTDERVKKEGNDIRALYHYQTNTVYLNVSANLETMTEESRTLREEVTGIHELVHVVQNQLRIFEEWRCLDDAEPLAFHIAHKYYQMVKDPIMASTKIRYSFRYLDIEHDPDRNYNRSKIGCDARDRAFYKNIILPRKRKAFESNTSP